MAGESSRATSSHGCLAIAYLRVTDDSGCAAHRSWRSILPPARLSRPDGPRSRSSWSCSPGPTVTCARNVLGVSEACGAALAHPALANGHRIPRVVGKGNQPASSPSRHGQFASDPSVGERVDGPLLVRPAGGRLDRHAAGRIVRRLADRAGIDEPISPHPLRHAAITAALASAREPSLLTPGRSPGDARNDRRSCGTTPATCGGRNGTPRRRMSPCTGPRVRVVGRGQRVAWVRVQPRGGGRRTGTRR